MDILAGTSRGIFRINGGAPVQTLTARGVRDIVRAGGRLMAGTGEGLWISDDDGGSWRCAALADREIWQIRQAGDGAIYAGTQPAGLFRSEDGGESWSEIESFTQSPEAARWCVPIDPPLPGRARAIVVDPDDPQRIAVGVEVGGIMLSEDRGRSWNLVMPGGNPDLHMMFADPAQPGVVYASTGYGRFDGIAEMVEGNAGVFRSDDGGRNWAYAWKGITPRYARPMCVDGRGGVALTVASAPTAFSHYRDEGGAGAMLYRSEDGGGSWRSLCDEAHTPSAPNFHGLTTDPERPGGVLVGTDNGELWRVSASAEWLKLGEGMPSVLAIHAD
ncbi:MAG: hypothetical protein TEF_17625 [Rhizobiales bacterium NRL2]|jgi:hypothetical protein|nr:MAG: hypothetical protein TEF_17625 [Rhizobiales bacterium NRL2]